MEWNGRKYLMLWFRIPFGTSTKGETASNVKQTTFEYFCYFFSLRSVCLCRLPIVMTSCSTGVLIQCRICSMYETNFSSLSFISFRYFLFSYCCSIIFAQISSFLFSVRQFSFAVFSFYCFQRFCRFSFRTFSEFFSIYCHFPSSKAFLQLWKSKSEKKVSCLMSLSRCYFLFYFCLCYQCWCWDKWSLLLYRLLIWHLLFLGKIQKEEQNHTKNIYFDMTLSVNRCANFFFRSIFEWRQEWRKNKMK